MKIKEWISIFFAAIKELMHNLFGKFIPVEALSDGLKIIHQKRMKALKLTWILMIMIPIISTRNTVKFLEHVTKPTFSDYILAFFISMAALYSLECIPVTLAHCMNLLKGSVIAALFMPSFNIPLLIVRIVLVPMIILVASGFTGWFFFILDMILFFTKKSLIYPWELKKIE